MPSTIFPKRIRPDLPLISAAAPPGILPSCGFTRRKTHASFRKTALPTRKLSHPFHDILPVANPVMASFSPTFRQPQAAASENGTGLYPAKRSGRHKSSHRKTLSPQILLNFV